MMPKRIRAKALFIYKKLFICYMGNFGNPLQFQPEKWRYCVDYYLAGKHFTVVSGEGVEAHRIGGNDGKVFRVSHKIPRLL